MTTPRMPGGILTECARCPFGAGKLHAFRGLCRQCGDEVRRAGNLADYPRNTIRALDLAEDAYTLRLRHGRPVVGGKREREVRRPDGTSVPVVAFGGRPDDDTGLSWAQIAHLLGVEPSRLEKARERCGWPDPHLGRPVRDPAVVAAERRARGRAVA